MWGLFRCRNLAEGSIVFKVCSKKKTDPWQPQFAGWYERRPLHDPNMVTDQLADFSLEEKEKTFGSFYLHGGEVWKLCFHPCDFRFGYRSCGAVVSAAFSEREVHFCACPSIPLLSATVPTTLTLSSTHPTTLSSTHPTTLSSTHHTTVLPGREHKNKSVMCCGFEQGQPAHWWPSKRQSLPVWPPIKTPLPVLFG